MPLAFRVADVAPRWRHVSKTMVQTIVMWSVFFVLLPFGIWHFERWLHIASWSTELTKIIGVIILLVSSLFGCWSSLTMAWVGAGTPLPSSTARHLVIAGPYRFVRNPMAISGLTQGAAIGLVLGSWVVLGGVLIGAVVWQLWVRPAEEANLAQRFGGDYQQYCQRVHAWLPRAYYRPEKKPTE